jgi:uncharacterized protein (TIGR02145 family)
MEKITIGDQIWMQNNLDVSEFRNGDPIKEALTWRDWENGNVNKEPMFCYYEFDSNNASKYGKFYTWAAVNDPRGLAPEGFFIAKDIDWDILSDFIAEENGYRGTNELATYLKGATSWLDDRNGDDEYGFNAIAAGKVDCSANFELQGHTCFWWSASEVGERGGQILAGNSDFARFRSINESDGFSIGNMNKMWGLSVRCLCEE